MKYIYLIGPSGGPPLKIGVSDNVRKRLKTLQTGQSAVLRIYGRWSHPSAELVEKECHRLLSTFRTGGEWFDVRPEDAVKAIEAAIQYVEERHRDGIAVSPESGPSVADVLALYGSSQLASFDSPVMRWLVDNADEFAAALAKVKRPNWNKIATALSDLGVRREDGGPMTGKSLAQCWYRTRKLLASEGVAGITFKPAPNCQMRKHPPLRLPLVN